MWGGGVGGSGEGGGEDTLFGVSSMGHLFVCWFVCLCVPQTALDSRDPGGEEYDIHGGESSRVPSHCVVNYNTKLMSRAFRLN